MPEVSLKGRLLVANPALPDPNFDRTVVLLLAHEDEGALGLVLNRPSDTEVDGPLPQWERLAARPSVVFVGGPVRPGAAICLARVSGKPGGEAFGTDSGQPGGRSGGEPGGRPGSGQPGGRSGGEAFGTDSGQPGAQSGGEAFGTDAGQPGGEAFGTDAGQPGGQSGGEAFGTDEADQAGGSEDADDTDETDDADDADETAGWTRLVGELGTLDLEQDPDNLHLGVEAIRVFAGYAGWGPDQLEREIDAGAWFVVPARPDDVMSDNPESLWKRVLRRQGGELAVVSLFPSDPSLN